MNCGPLPAHHQFRVVTLEGLHCPAAHSIQSVQGGGAHLTQYDAVDKKASAPVIDKKHLLQETEQLNTSHTLAA